MAFVDALIAWNVAWMPLSWNVDMEHSLKLFLLSDFQTEIKYGVVEGGSTMNFFKTSSMPAYQTMWNFMSGIIFIPDFITCSGPPPPKKNLWSFFSSIFGHIVQDAQILLKSFDAEIMVLNFSCSTTCLDQGSISYKLGPRRKSSFIHLRPMPNFLRSFLLAQMLGAWA